MRSGTIIEGCEHRFRPVMMTATVAMLALVPMLFSTGPGSEVTRPLAVVVIGGLITSTSLTLLVLPVLFGMFGQSKAALAASRAEAEELARAAARRATKAAGDDSPATH